MIGSPKRTISPTHPMKTSRDAIEAAFRVCEEEDQRTHSTHTISDTATVVNAMHAVAHAGKLAIPDRKLKAVMVLAVFLV